MTSRDGEDDTLSGTQISDEERFRDCERFVFTCPDCGKQNILDNAFTGAVSYPGNVIVAVLKIPSQNEGITVENLRASAC